MNFGTLLKVGIVSGLLMTDSANAGHNKKVPSQVLPTENSDLNLVAHQVPILVPITQRDIKPYFNISTILDWTSFHKDDFRQICTYIHSLSKKELAQVISEHRQGVEALCPLLVNRQKFDVLHKIQNVDTSVFLAVNRYGHSAISRMALAYKTGNSNAQQYVSTLLHRYPELCKAQDSDGRSIAHHAVRIGNKPLVNLIAEIDPSSFSALAKVHKDFSYDSLYIAVNSNQKQIYFYLIAEKLVPVEINDYAHVGQLLQNKPEWLDDLKETDTVKPEIILNKALTQRNDTLIETLLNDYPNILEGGTIHLTCNWKYRDGRNIESLLAKYDPKIPKIIDTVTEMIGSTEMTPSQKMAIINIIEGCDSEKEAHLDTFANEFHNAHFTKENIHTLATLFNTSSTEIENAQHNHFTHHISEGMAMTAMIYYVAIPVIFSVCFLLSLMCNPEKTSHRH